MNEFELRFDRIAEDTTPDGLTAFCSVPKTLAIFESHFPRYPVLPGVFLLDCMANLAGLLMERRSGGWWSLSTAERLRFRHAVRPGDQVEIAVHGLVLAHDEGQVGARAMVDKRLVASAQRLRLRRS